MALSKLLLVPFFTKHKWMMHFVILMYLTGINAESEPYVFDAVGD